MIRITALAAALLCALFTMPAEARQRIKSPACVEAGDVMRPTCGMGFVADTAKNSRDFFTASDGRRVTSIKATMKREPRAFVRRGAAAAIGLSYGSPSSDVGYTIARPARYIAGRLICAVNIGAALAERGIKGTGSALAHSYDRWGVRVAQPVPGAVAVTDRRGGGHVALVSRVEGSRVFVWNPSSRGRGWREVEYTNRNARYRVAG